MAKWALGNLRSTCVVPCTLTRPPRFMAARPYPSNRLLTHTLRHLPSSHPPAEGEGEPSPPSRIARVLVRILGPSASRRPHSLTRHETVPSGDPRHDRLVRAVLLLPAGPGRRRLLDPQEAAPLLQQQEGRRPPSFLAGRGAPRSGETSRTHVSLALSMPPCLVQVTSLQK